MNMQSKPKKYLVDKNLVDWLKERKNTDFPLTQSSKDTYPLRYEETAKHMEKIHKEVEKGALLKSIQDQMKSGSIDEDKIIYLNNHGPQHIGTVINRASEILQVSKCKITPYEGYLLLMSIQFHDVGIIYGRNDHEKNCWQIMRDLGTRVGLDKAEQKNIIKIASVHGGIIEGDKDTISSLQEKIDLMGQRGIRKSFLAALLRFSDEISDDSLRATSYLGTQQLLPKCCEVYHLYSESLHSVTIDKNQINLSYDLDKEIVFKKYDKNTKRVFLLDEIYDRSLKMHCERMYCMRFLRPFIEIDKIRIKIEIYFGGDVLSSEKINYSLQEKGYPDHSNTYLFTLCPQLIELTGTKVKKLIKDKERHVN